MLTWSIPTYLALKHAQKPSVKATARIGKMPSSLQTLEVLFPLFITGFLTESMCFEVVCEWDYLFLFIRATFSNS